MSKKLTPGDLEARFWKHIHPEPNTGCWLWGGPASTDGYGRLGGQAAPLAHRWAYERFVGPIPTGLLVCHRCDTPACANPAHLFAGTNADNRADAVKKRRHRNPMLPGVANPNARLSDEQVREIRALDEAGVGATAIARRFGITKSYAWKVANRWCWRHVV